MTAQQNLFNFIQLMNSPSMLPDIAGVGFLAGGAISAVATVVAWLGIVSLLFVALKIGVDVVLMSGLDGFLDKQKESGARIIKVSSFYAGGKLQTVSDSPISYIKDHAWKILLQLAFIGLMISGQLFPLAGTITATSGAVLAKVANINPVPYIEAFTISELSIVNAISKSNYPALIKTYQKYNSYMSAATDSLKDTSNMTTDEYNKIAAAYFNSYYAAELYRLEIQSEVDKINEIVRSDERQLTKEEIELKNFDASLHKKSVDRQLLSKAEKAENVPGLDLSLKQRAISKGGN